MTPKEAATKLKEATVGDDYEPLGRDHISTAGITYQQPGYT